MERASCLGPISLAVIAGSHHVVQASYSTRHFSRASVDARSRTSVPELLSKACVLPCRVEHWVHSVDLVTKYMLLDRTDAHAYAAAYATTCTKKLACVWCKHGQLALVALVPHGVVSSFLQTVFPCFTRFVAPRCGTSHHMCSSAVNESLLDLAAACLV